MDNFIQQAMMNTSASMNVNLDIKGEPLIEQCYNKQVGCPILLHVVKLFTYIAYDLATASSTSISITARSTT